MDLKIKNYLPVFFIVLGAGLIVGGLYNVPEKTLLSIGLLFIGLVLVTTQYRLEIILKKNYREYVWAIALKWGGKIKFDEIHYFYLSRPGRSPAYLLAKSQPICCK